MDPTRFLKLSQAAISEVGSAALTLGGVWYVSHTSGDLWATYAHLGKLTAQSCATIKRHLRLLVARGYLERPSRGRYRLTEKTRSSFERFYRLPLEVLAKVKPWSARLLAAMPDIGAPTRTLARAAHLSRRAVQLARRKAAAFRARILSPMDRRPKILKDLARARRPSSPAEARALAQITAAIHSGKLAADAVRQLAAELGTWAAVACACRLEANPPPGLVRVAESLARKGPGAWRPILRTGTG